MSQEHQYPSQANAVPCADRFTRLVGLAYEEVDETATENDFFSHYRATDQFQQRCCAAAVAGVTVLALAVAGIMSMARHNATEQQASQAEQVHVQENSPPPAAIASVPHTVAHHPAKH